MPSSVDIHHAMRAEQGALEISIEGISAVAQETAAEIVNRQGRSSDPTHDSAAAGPGSVVPVS
jgi:hypothetical protein